MVAALRSMLNVVSPHDRFHHEIIEFVYDHHTELFDALEDIEPERLRDTLVVLDLESTAPEPWNTGRSGPWFGVAAELTLGFPEVFPVFVGGERFEHSSCAHCLDDLPPDLVGLHEIRDDLLWFMDRCHFVSLSAPARLWHLALQHAYGRRQLFDHSGLRSLLKLGVVVSATESRARAYGPVFLSRLAHRALVTDEEIAFVQLSGLAAYMAGMRASAAWSYREWRSLLGVARGESPKNARKRWSKMLNGADQANVGHRREMDDIYRSPIVAAISDWDLAFFDLGKRDRKRWEGDSTTGGDAGDHSQGMASHLVWSLEYGEKRRPRCPEDPVKQNPNFWRRLQGRFTHRTRGEAGKSPSPPVVFLSNFAGPVRKWVKAKSARAHVQEKPLGGVLDILLPGFEEGDSLPSHGCEWTPGDDSNAFSERFRATLQEIEQEIDRASEKGDEGRTDTQSNHSASFVQTAVARRLLLRARRLLAEQSGQPEEYIHAALLSLEAKEILGGVSKTLAYSAIAAQHEAQVMAETSFHGTKAELSVAARFEVIEREAQVLESPLGDGRKSKQKKRSFSDALLNFLAQTSNHLRGIFNQSEQVSAAECCLRRHCDYRLRLQWQEIKGASWWKAICQAVLYLGAKYANWATRSGTSLATLLRVSLLWILVFGVFFGLPFWAEAECKKIGLSHQLMSGLARSAYTFLQIEPGLELGECVSKGMPEDCPTSTWVPASLTWFGRVLVLVEMVIAYLHLGLLIGVAYRIVTKRAP